MAARMPEYILAIDYGEKRVGLAIAHVVSKLPRPLKTLTNDASLLSNLNDTVASEDVALLVVGLPRGMDGGYTAQTRLTEAFAEQLRSVVTVPLLLVDETLTSIDAEAVLRGKSHHKQDIDALAATFILERYLAEQMVEERHA